MESSRWRPREPSRAPRPSARHTGAAHGALQYPQTGYHPPDRRAAAVPAPDGRWKPDLGKTDGCNRQQAAALVLGGGDPCAVVDVVRRGRVVHGPDDGSRGAGAVARAAAAVVCEPAAVAVRG